MSVSVDLSRFLIKIWDATVGQLKHLQRPKSRVEQLERARDKLRARAADIDRSISLAQLEGKIPSNQIHLWKSEVEELEGKAAAIEQDFERRRWLASWSWNCFSVNRRVAKRMEEIDKLMTRADATPVATEQPPPAIVQIPTSDSTLAMEVYMREIQGYIASVNGNVVIGVYGMGGVGKTTFLRSINNHGDATLFDHVIWAVASKECKMERLQMDIAKRLKLHMAEDDNEEDRAANLFDFLKNKDCLLLLDDVWAPLDLAKLGMVHVSSGQGDQQKRKVVVFTTRHKQVCSGMKASRKMEIKCLESTQAWELFRRNTGEDVIRSDAGINRIAHQIAEECAGLPLALVTVGMAMSIKKSWEAWNDALKLLKHSQMPKVTGMKEADPMFFAFRLSYDSLEDDDMRGRLLSCALWPEDHSIKKDKLIQCWMGLGLIKEVTTIHEAYNRGHSHIETLRAVCLLELGDEQEEVKMHDVIRDMALWMASDCGMNKFKWIVRVKGAASQAIEEEAWRDVERVSLMYNNIAFLPNQFSTCSKLSVLMLQQNNKLEKICGSLIQGMCALTYLDLEASRLMEIPKEIGILSELRHLNLSYTQIKELPAELGSLVKLNYLLLRYTIDLTTVATGAISNLSSLKLLDLRGSRYKDSWDELERLEVYQTSIGIHITKATDLSRLCSLAHVSTWRLKVAIWRDSTNLKQLLDDIMRSRNIRQNIEHLAIELSEMDELLISEGKEAAGGFECLTQLDLFFLNRLKEITWIGVQPQIVFPNLRELSIHRCLSLRNLNWILQLPSLSVLNVSDCEMEELISDEGTTNSLYFGLRRMRLDRMCKLKRIVPTQLHFPYLKELEVRDCPLLRKLTLDNRISMNKRLHLICSEGRDNLEWEELSIKQLPLVQIS